MSACLAAPCCTRLAAYGPVLPWRADFPALAVLEAQGQTYLDSAATAKPQALIDTLSGYYTCGAANVHRAQHQPAERATRAYEDARIKVARWLNAACPTEIVFTRGATEALNLLAYGLEHLIKAGDEIVISALEHHANLLPWQQLINVERPSCKYCPSMPPGVSTSPRPPASSGRARCWR